MKTKLLFAVLILSTLVNAQSMWVTKSPFSGGQRRSPVGFSIGTKGYIGTGVNTNTGVNQKDFWEYNPTSNVWTQKADFGGVGREGATGFSIGNKGYMGTGVNGSVPVYYKDFWEYNPSNNAWVQKTDFGGGPSAARSGAVGFSIGTKGYIGTGVGTQGDYKDFWEYNPSNNAWVQKTDFGGSARKKAAGFSIGSKGYIGTGTGIVSYIDFWEYDQSADVWIQIANYPGQAISGSVSFSIGNTGYVGLGKVNSNVTGAFFVYDQTTGQWASGPSLTQGSGARTNAIGFSIGTKGYAGTGTPATGIGGYADFLELDVCTSTSVTVTASGPTTFCQGNSVTLTASGSNYYSWNNGESTQSVIVQSTTMTGNYSYSVAVTDVSGCTAMSSTTIVTVEQCTGIQTFNQDEMNIYAHSSEIFFHLTKDAEIIMMDLSGRIIFHKSFSTGHFEIPCEPGFYLFQVVTREEIISKKIIVFKN